MGLAGFALHLLILGSQWLQLVWTESAPLGPGHILPVLSWAARYRPLTDTPMCFPLSDPPETQGLSVGDFHMSSFTPALMFEPHIPPEGCTVSSWVW